MSEKSRKLDVFRSDDSELEFNPTLLYYSPKAFGVVNRFML